MALTRFDSKAGNYKLVVGDGLSKKLVSFSGHVAMVDESTARLIEENPRFKQGWVTKHDKEEAKKKAK